jgi:TonB family protein
MTLSVSAGIVTICVLSTFASAQASSIPTPRKIRDVKPVYPRESLHAGDEDVVLLELSITASGTVRDALILAAGCQRLDKAALTAVWQWRFEPMQLNGNPTPFTGPPTFTSGCRRSFSREPVEPVRAGGQNHESRSDEL